MDVLHNALSFPDKTKDENSPDDYNRRVQENNGEGEFELTVGLTKTNDSAASNGMIESRTTRLMSLAVGAAGVTGAGLMV